MPANISINQTTLSAGVQDTSRADGVLAQTVTCTNDSAESTYLWTIVDVPIRSALSRGTVSASALLTFVPDTKGTYLVSLRVNNSLLPTDNQSLFISVASSGDFTLGWRYPAAQEDVQDNTDYTGLGFPSDANSRGWATTRDLQLEATENAVARVQQATDTVVAAGVDALVKVDTATGQIAPELLPGSTLFQLSGATNETITGSDPETALGGFVFTGGSPVRTDLIFRLVGVLTVAGAGDGFLRLYDMGAVGAAPSPGILRSSITLPNADNGNMVVYEQALTVADTPGVDADEVAPVATRYELRTQLVGGSGSDLLKIHQGSLALVATP